MTEDERSQDNENGDEPEEPRGESGEKINDPLARRSAEAPRRSWGKPE
ncbi:MAG: hypothetical protein M3378_08945 [Actinomycetota bacterium]|nr:hypothetical protein [Actinomycetota bacterium]